MSPNRITRVLIIGAGEAGRRVAEIMGRHEEAGLQALAFIDDDPAKAGTTVLGLPVFGDRSTIPAAIRELKIDEILIAMPSASGQDIRGVVAYCESARVKFRVVPGIWSIIRGDVHLQQIRPVRPEDMLGRETVELDLPLIRNVYQGKRLLVTGAGGSIGSEICRQLLLSEPAELIVVGRGENSIFEAEVTFRERAGATRIETIIGDVRNRALLERTLTRVRPHAVFHAAAHKHVWLMEQNPVEAVENNALGTADLVEMTIAAGAERFVLISTDKAVNPTAVMGATKRMAELYLLERAAQLPAGSTRLMAVRFGNVLGSRGSVVPIFQRQIARGGPVTVSHPEVARYFMTIKEASLLVVEAGAIGHGGEIFILDMGDQMPIHQLARDLITLSGFRPESDIPISFVGLKPGEKMREELVLDCEKLSDTPVHGIRVTKGLPPGQAPIMGATMETLRRLVAAGDAKGLVAEINRLIPEAQLAWTPTLLPS